MPSALHHRLTNAPWRRPRDAEVGCHVPPKRRPARVDDLKPALGKTGDALLLVKSDGSQWGKSHQARPMGDACSRAKIKPAASFHILRHTWASLAIMAGAPLMVVARNLGHADTRIVERHYGHLAPSYIADAIRAAAPRFDIAPDRKLVSIEGR
jgi:integrase